MSLSSSSEIVSLAAADVAPRGRRGSALVLTTLATLAMLLALASTPTVVAARLGSVVSAHDTGAPFIFVGSTGAGGGALSAEHGLATPIELTESARVGGFVLYTATDPSFEPPDEEDDELFFLADGTSVTVEIVAVGTSVAMKLRGVELDQVGDSVVLGTAPTLHQHPEWQLTLPDGERGCQAISFRLTTDAPSYQASAIYTAYLTNDETTCVLATATPTPVPTATPGGGRTCGDADGSGTVTVTDGVATLREAAGLDRGCAVATTCDVDGSGSVTVSDGVNVLRSAAGLATSFRCPNP